MTDSIGVEYHSPGDFISSWVSIISYFAGSHRGSLNIILWCYMNFLWQGDVNQDIDYLSVLLYVDLVVSAVRCCYILISVCLKFVLRDLKTFSFVGCLPAGVGFWWAITPAGMQGSELWSLDGKSITDYFCTYWYSEVFAWELCPVRPEYAEQCRVLACWWWNLVPTRASTGLQGSGRL